MTKVSDCCPCRYERVQASNKYSLCVEPIEVSMGSETSELVLRYNIF